MAKTYAQLELEAQELVIEMGRLRRENARMRKALKAMQEPLYQAYMTVCKVEIEGSFDF